MTFVCVNLLPRNMKHQGCNGESLSDEDEEYEYEDEGEGDSQHQPSADLLIHLLRVHIRHDPNDYNTTSNTKKNSSHKPGTGNGVAATSLTAIFTTATTPTPASTSTTITWQNSKRKQHIINEMKDKLSIIHLMVGRYEHYRVTCQTLLLRHSCRDKTQCTPVMQILTDGNFLRGS